MVGYFNGSVKSVNKISRETKAKAINTLYNPHKNIFSINKAKSEFLTLDSAIRMFSELTFKRRKNTLRFLKC